MIEARRLQRLFDRVVATRRNCSFDDIQRLLLAIGFRARWGSGSHVTFKLRMWRLSIPRGDPVGRTYVDEAIAIVREVMENGETS